MRLIENGKNQLKSTLNLIMNMIMKIGIVYIIWLIFVTFLIGCDE